MATTKKTIAAGQQPKSSVVIRDAHNINSRLQNQVSHLLTQLEEGEHVTMRERVQALMAIARIQVAFMSLRKEKSDEPERGSAVRKYAAAFQENDARRRAASAGSAVAIAAETTDDLGGAGWEDGNDDDAA